MDKQKVSIVMCTYNGEKHLHKQMDSILHQTYPIYELIIQDDCSTDGTFGILQDYAQRYPFVRIFQNEKQKGINENFFSAIMRASGDFIAISDQDDIWEPQKVEWQIGSIGDKFLSGGISRPFTNEGETIKVHIDTRPPNIYLERIIFNTMIPGHTMLFRKELLDKVPQLSQWSEIYMYDHLLQIVAASYDSVSFYPEVLVHHRRSAESATLAIPYSYEKNIRNIFRTVSRTFSLYSRIREPMIAYFKSTNKFLNEINSETSSWKNSERLTQYMSKRCLVSFIKSSFLCVKLRDRIFYSVEKNELLAILRALYFPVSCSDYFRYMDKKRIS